METNSCLKIIMNSRKITLSKIYVIYVIIMGLAYKYLEHYEYWNISSAYSCLHYLKKELEKNANVELWSLTPGESLAEEYGNGYYSFYDQKYWRIPCADVNMDKYILKFYKNHADFPDIIIKCLPVLEQNIGYK